MYDSANGFVTTNDCVQSVLDLFFGKFCISGTGYWHSV